MILVYRLSINQWLFSWDVSVNVIVEAPQSRVRKVHLKSRRGGVFLDRLVFQASVP